MLLSILVFVACHAKTPDSSDPGDTSDTAGSVDTITNRLREGTDLCAYEDGEVVEVPEAEPEEGYIADPYPELYQPCLDGVLSVSARVLDHPEGRIEDHAATAQFFSVNDFVHSWQMGSWLDPQEGADDCGLIAWDSSGLVTDSDLAWLDPGDVSLSAPWGEVAMTRTPGGFVLSFEAALSEADIEPAWGEAHGLSATGSSGSSGDGVDWAGAGAVDLSELVTLPERLEVTAPTPLGPDVVLARADTELEWTGTADGELALRLTASAEGDVGLSYELRCAVTDDGAFTLPGALLEALPEGATGTLTLSRRLDTWAGTGSGRTFHAFAQTRYEAWNLAIP